MKKVFFTIFLLLFLANNESVAQTDDIQIILDEGSYFELNEEEVDNFSNKALTAYESDKFKQAGLFFIKAFKYSSGRDRSLLYNGLNSFISAEDVDNATVCYDKFLEVGIDDLKKKELLKLHKNMAIIYDTQNDSEKFFQVIDRAIVLNENENEIDFFLIKANHYFKTGDTTNFMLNLNKVHQIDPNHFNTNYNLGFLYYEKGDFNKSKYHYQKALKANKKSEAANLNYAVLLLSQENEIIEEMNSLGVSREDSKKYDALKKQREKIHKSAIPYLKKVLKINSKNTEVIKTLTAIYEGLGYDKKIEKLKKQTS